MGALHNKSWAYYRKLRVAWLAPIPSLHTRSYSASASAIAFHPHHPWTRRNDQSLVVVYAAVMAGMYWSFRQLFLSGTTGLGWQPQRVCTIAFPDLKASSISSEMCLHPVLCISHWISFSRSWRICYNHSISPSSDKIAASAAALWDFIYWLFVHMSILVLLSTLSKHCFILISKLSHREANTNVAITISGVDSTERSHFAQQTQKL